MNDLEALAQGYRQFGSTSAVIGGLAFAAATAILATGAGSTDRRTLSRPAIVTVGAATASAASLVFASVVWAFLSVQAVRAAAQAVTLGESVRALNRPASLAFIFGFGLFFVAVGASGWIGSRALGVFTGIVAALGGLGGLLLILRFAA